MEGAAVADVSLGQPCGMGKVGVDRLWPGRAPSWLRKVLPDDIVAVLEGNNGML